MGFVQVNYCSQVDAVILNNSFDFNKRVNLVLTINTFLYYLTKHFSVRRKLYLKTELQGKRHKAE